MIDYGPIANLAPRTGGVYALAYEGRVFYVGESKNVRNRINGHFGYAMRHAKGPMYAWMHDIFKSRNGQFVVHMLLVTSMPWRPSRELAETAWIDYFARKGPLFNVRNFATTKHQWFVDLVWQAVGSDAGVRAFGDAVLDAVERHAREELEAMRGLTVDNWSI